MTQLICLAIYFLVGYIFYVAVYVKQKGVEKLKREWIRALIAITLYPLTISATMIMLIFGAFKESKKWV
jgi:hypothetical protein